MHISIHDLSPASLPAVHEIIEFLGARGIERTTLLVIPDSGWDDRGIAALKELEQQGHMLAGHGWTHHAPRWGSCYHFLHGVTLSRRVAEHLCLDEQGIARLIRDNHAWFGAHGLTPPTHYVPPAWAMGPISRDRLRQLPFRTYEFLGGIYRADTGNFERSPLLGFEADTGLRALFLRCFNGLNLRRARRTRELLRISLHPRDLHLRLGTDLDRILGLPLTRSARSHPFPAAIAPIPA